MTTSSGFAPSAVDALKSVCDRCHGPRSLEFRGEKGLARDFYIECYVPETGRKELQRFFDVCASCSELLKAFLEPLPVENGPEAPKND